MYYRSYANSTSRDGLLNSLNSTVTPEIPAAAAKEVYSGGFQNIKTRNPFLLIGNTFDPLAPLISPAMPASHSSGANSEFRMGIE
jgi:hypothetical protein